MERNHTNLIEHPHSASRRGGSPETRHIPADAGLLCRLDEGDLVVLAVVDDGRHDNIDALEDLDKFLMGTEKVREHHVDSLVLEGPVGGAVDCRRAGESRHFLSSV